MKNHLRGVLGILVLLSAGRAAGRTWDFETAELGRLPSGWSSARTGEGPGNVWQVVAVADAPRGKQALTQVSPDGPRPVFNLCVCNEVEFRDVLLNVAFKAVGGKIDQGGGLVWRYRDPDNYYLARMNPLEDNFRVYKVAGGKRTQLGSADVKVPAGQWHRLGVTHVGKQIRCFLDGRLYLEVQDETFADPGKFGLWTKADAATSFDDVSAEAVPDRCVILVSVDGWAQFYLDDPLAGRTNIFICGDHGFVTIERDVLPNVALRKLGLIEVSGGKVTRQAAYSLSQGGGAAVYVLDRSRRAEIAAQLKTELAKLEGVEAVFAAPQFAQLGQPTPEQDPRAADLWLAAKSGYSFSDSTGGDAVVVPRKSVGGTHGFLPDQPDLLSACVAWGPQIKPGTDWGKIRILDVAPTIARILGVELPTAEGRTLPIAVSP